MDTVSGLVGGIGVFLLGMALLTDGLKTIAGDSLRQLLSRITGRPLAAFATGAGVTAIVQSSSATTVATIGLVSAGLLPLENALGVIFGANIGTTSTGWIVALLGLKLDIGKLAMPIIAGGVLLKLLSSDRKAALGLSIAGFGLIFVGIDLLKVAMKELATRVDPSTIPGETILGALLLVLVGTLMTVLMQSSSAAVATTLTAMHAGTIDLDQAAYLVIGQNVGTTVTAAIAAFGASSAAKRAAAAHVIFNIGTGAVAFLMVPGFVWGIQRAIPDSGTSVLSLSAFHTVFNVVGVLIFMPIRRPLAGWLSRAIGRGERNLTVHLDPAVATLPAVAIDAARRTVMQTAGEVAEAIRELLVDPTTRRSFPARLERAQGALDETRDFLGRVRTAPSKAEHATHVGVLHAIDHVTRLIEAAHEARPAEIVFKANELSEPGSVLADAIGALLPWLRSEGEPPHAPEAIAAGASRGVVELRRRQRVETIRGAAEGDVSSGAALHRLEAMRWLDRLAYHLWRATVHLQAPEHRERESEQARAASDKAIDPESTDATPIDPGPSAD